MNFDEAFDFYRAEMARLQSELDRLKKKPTASPLEILMQGVNYNTTKQNLILIQTLRDEMREATANIIKGDLRE